MPKKISFPFSKGQKMKWCCLFFFPLDTEDPIEPLFCHFSGGEKKVGWEWEMSTGSKKEKESEMLFQPRSSNAEMEEGRKSLSPRRKSEGCFVDKERRWGWMRRLFLASSNGLSLSLRSRGEEEKAFDGQIQSLPSLFLPGNINVIANTPNPTHPSIC